MCYKRTDEVKRESKANNNKKSFNKNVEPDTRMGMLYIINTKNETFNKK